MAKIYSARDFLEVTNKMYKVCGWNYNLNAVDGKLKRIQEIYFWTLNILFALMILQSFTAVLQNVGNFEKIFEVTETLLCIGFMTMLILKSYFVVYRNREALTDMLDELDEVIPKVGGVQRKYDVKSYCQKTRLASITCSVIYWSLMISYNTMPITEKILGLIYGVEAQRSLPFKFYYPFNPFKNYIYPMVYVYETWLCCKCGVEILGSDLLFCNFTSVIHMRLEILEKELVEIDARDKKGSVDKLKELVRVYQKLIDINEKLEELYSFSLLADLLASTMITCFAAFNAFLGMNGFSLLKFVLCFFVSLFRIGMQCYHVDRLTRASLRLADGAYENLWYEGSEKYKKMLMFIMVRAQKPLNITAYKFQALSLESFTGFVRSSYSFFALMRTMYHGDA